MGNVFEQLGLTRGTKPKDKIYELDIGIENPILPEITDMNGHAA